MTDMYSETSRDDISCVSPMTPLRQTPLGLTPTHFGLGFSDEELDLQEESDLDDMDDMSDRNYSPPAWRRDEDGIKWWGHAQTRRDMFGSTNYEPRRINHTNASIFQNDIFEAARRTRLPTGSLSPEKGVTPEAESPTEDDTLVKMKSESLANDDVNGEATRNGDMASVSPGSTGGSFVRLVLRADIQQRTEPIEALINFLRSKSWANIIVMGFIAFISMTAIRTLCQPAPPRPSPDLVKVAGIARSFEPLIYFSENGVSQVSDLQATGIAVWDLGESVRSSNMTSAPIIVKSLDELSESLKTLAIELTRFFSDVDGDIDSILIVMDWARRELSQVQAVPNQALSTAFSNLHTLLSLAGVFENPSTGMPTRLGDIMTTLFGISHTQQTRYALQRTFTEFLSVLEEAIESELRHSLSLFALFEAIDRQFLNLGRIVVRESSQQDEEHADLLSSLWTRLLGPKVSEVKKYERNRELLQNVREKTVRNKGILVEHNGKLLTLKANLETLRRKLVSPLVRSVNSSTLSIEEQIKSLEDVGLYLDNLRARQRSKLIEMVHSSSSPRATIAGNSRLIEKQGRWA